MKKNNKKGLSIKVIGCGGIGSWLVDPLCTLLSYCPVPSVDVTLIDGDVYEERNRERQNFDEIGPKASITARRLRKNFGRLNFIEMPSYLTDENIEDAIRDGDIVLSCVDNHKTRKLVNDRSCELKDVVVISGGNELTDGNVLVHIRRNGEDVTLPIANEYQPEIQNPKDKNPGEEVHKKKSCQELVPSTPQLVAMNFAIASTMLNILYKVVNNHEKVGSYSKVDVDILLNKASPKLYKKAKKTAAA